MTRRDAALLAAWRTNERVTVDHRRVTPRQLAAALARSSRGIEALLRFGLEAGGELPPSRGYVYCGSG